MIVLFAFLFGCGLASVGIWLVWNEMKHPGKNQAFFDKFRK